jgi:hypothetical protein
MRLDAKTSRSSSVVAAAGSAHKPQHVHWPKPGTKKDQYNNTPTRAVHAPTAAGKAARIPAPYKRG